MGLLTPLAKERGYSSAQARGAAKKVALTVWAGVGVPGSYGHLFEAEAMERHEASGELQIPAQCLGRRGELEERRDPRCHSHIKVCRRVRPLLKIRTVPDNGVD